MILDAKLMDAVSFGKTKMFIDEYGYSFSRFTDEQKEIWSLKNSYFPEEFYDGYFYRNCSTDANIKIDFITDSAYFRITISKIESLNGSANLDVEVFVNGEKTLNINECGEYSLMLKKRNRVQIFLPSFAHVHFKSIEVEDNSEIVPAKHKLRWLAHGDSITHGCGSIMTSLSYVSRIARKADVEVINQANSGYINDERIITKIDGWEPDIVTSAYGTNDVVRKTIDEYRKDLYALCEKLKIEFPKSKIYVLSPVWSAPLYEDTRYSYKTPDIYKIFDGINDMDGISLINGLKLIPNDRKYFLADGTHPNDMGYSYYASRLGKILFPDIS